MNQTQKYNQKSVRKECKAQKETVRDGGALAVGVHEVQAVYPAVAQKPAGYSKYRAVQGQTSTSSSTTTITKTMA